MSTGDSTARQLAFGPYEILGTLGHGGMGVVYQAYDRNLGRSIALKILRDELRGEAKIAARFHREAEAFGRLDHPNIVHVYSVGVVEDIPFIAMELVEGDTLADRMRRHGRIPWREVLGYGAQVARALGSAHQARIIHRDIKPGNILIDVSGRVRVTDFGIAKILDASTQLTTDGTRLGTPQYMCPERCQNRKVSPSSDIYSLGVVMFQAITGRLPYDARSSTELVREICRGQPKRVRDFVPDAPEGIDRLLAYMLESDPEKRPASADALAATIARVMEGGGLDEHAEHLVQQLDAYRRSLPDVRPVTPNPDTPTEVREARDGWSGRVRRRWFRLSRGVRLGVAAALILALCGAGALGVQEFLRQPHSAVDSISSLSAVERWSLEPSFVTWSSETPTVALAHLTWPEFKTADAVWQTDGTLAVAVAGTGSRQGQRGVLTLDPHGKSTRLLMPPVPDGAESWNSLAVSAGGGLLIGADAGLREVTAGVWYPGEPLPGRSLWTTGVSAVSPGRTNRLGHQVHAVAFNDPQYGDWRIALITSPDYRRSESIVPGGPRITAVALGRDATTMSYVRAPATDPAKERELWRSTLAGSVERTEQRIATGNVSIAAGGISELGDITYSMTSPEGTRVYVSPADGEQKPRVLFSGDWAQWLSPNELIFEDADRMDRAQLYQAGRNAGAARQALTFFESGILPRSSRVEPDARTAAAVLPDGVTIAIIDLRSVASL